MTFKRKKVKLSNLSNNSYYQSFATISVSEVAQLIKNDELDIHLVDSNGFNSLSYAIFFDRKDLFDYLKKQHVVVLDEDNLLPTQPAFRNIVNLAFATCHWALLKEIIFDNSKLHQDKKAFDEVFNQVLQRDEPIEVYDLFEHYQMDVAKYSIYSHNIYTKAAYNSFTLLFDLLENKKLNPHTDWLERDEKGELIYLRAALNSHVVNTVDYYLNVIKISEEELTKNDANLFFNYPYFILQPKRFLKLLDTFSNLATIKNKDGFCFIEEYAALSFGNVKNIQLLLEHPMYQSLNNKKGKKNLVAHMLKNYVSFEKIKEAIDTFSLEHKDVINIYFSLNLKKQNELQEFLSSYEKELLKTSIDDSNVSKKRVKKI